MTRTHVLLDLDGTISDSSLGIARSLQHAFATCGFEPPGDEAVRAVIGPPFEATLPGLGVPTSELERVVLAYRERYEDVGLFENELYPGVPEMLTDLAGAGYSLALATAKPEPTAVRIIEHFGLTDHFVLQAGASVTVGSGRRTKAEVIAHALGELARLSNGRHLSDDRDRDGVVMVGDRDHDVDGASHNGIDCIGVSWGFGTHDELHGAGAAAVVDSPAEVVGAVAATYRSGRP